MRITGLRLRDFRGYQQVLLTPPEGVTMLVGENGAGKTNLLEAVHLCCVGRSHRTSQDKEMIRKGQETAAVQLTVEKNDGRHEVGVRLFENARKRKVVFVNGKTASRLGELMGHATCVIFSPEDLALVKEGPQARRRFLDMLLSQEQKAYFYALQTYMTALKQRNALLKQGDIRSLPAWDEQLAAAAAPLVRLRREAPGALLVLTGCAARLVADFVPRRGAPRPEADLLVPPERKEELASSAFADWLAQWLAAQALNTLSWRIAAYSFVDSRAQAVDIGCGGEGTAADLLLRCRVAHVDSLPDNVVLHAASQIRRIAPVDEINTSVSAQEAVDGADIAVYVASLVHLLQDFQCTFHDVEREGEGNPAAEAVHILLAGHSFQILFD